jgi:[CysO sulfur-carrier protein]-S-L-cysteine hydrolase
MPATNQTTEHRLEIDPAMLQAIIDHVQHWLPYEGCGLLATDGYRVVKIYPGDNVARSETFYEMDPKQVFAAMREIERSGLRLGAIFHSHPSTKAYPSPTDLNLVFDPGVYMMIISLAGEEPDVRVFRYEDEIEELPLIVTESGNGDGQ